MLKSYLDFEQPIADLEQKLLDLKDSDMDEESVKKEVIRLNESIMKVTEKIYSSLSPWQNVQVARHPERPHFLDYIERISDGENEERPQGGNGSSLRGFISGLFCFILRGNGNPTWRNGERHKVDHDNTVGVQPYLLQESSGVQK